MIPFVLLMFVVFIFGFCCGGVFIVSAYKRNIESGILSFDGKVYSVKEMESES